MVHSWPLLHEAKLNCLLRNKYLFHYDYLFPEIYIRTHSFSHNTLTHCDYLPMTLACPFMNNTIQIFDVWAAHKGTISLIQLIH